MKGLVYKMSKLIDLTGQKFGRLTVIAKDNNRKSSTGSYWVCQCECGKIKSIRSASLRKGEIQSCGCYRKDKLSELKTEDLINQKFGMLTVICKSDNRTSDNRVKWNCICDCGNIVEVIAKDLKSGHTQSCGCSHRSFGEIEIEQILNKNNIEFIPQYRFLDFKNRIYDFALIKNNQVIKLIEFDGEQHYHNKEFWKDGLKEIQKRDQEKNEYAKTNNIPLIRIPYWEKNHITLDLINGDKYLIK